MSIRFLCGTCIWLFILTSSLLAQEFSADMIETTDGDTSQRKVYVSKGKMRYEDPKSASILDLDTHKVWILMLAQHTYFESEITGHDADQLSLLRTTDAENACATWKKVADEPGGSCTKVGHESVNGRDTIKYETKSREGEASTVWVDSKLSYMIKWQGDTNGEMKNIQPGAQAASLFEIPAGFHKMSMPGMPPHK